MSNKRSAAVPFTNQKGERSMKKVKVERYVAGKKPGYAKEEDEEYYTTDDEQFDEEQGSGAQSDESDIQERLKPKLEDLQEAKYSSSTSRYRDSQSRELVQEAKPKVEIPSDIDEEEDDDPRFRRLKQVEKSKPTINRINDMPTTSRSDSKRMIIDDDEDEEEIRQRHALARSKEIEQPIGPQVVFGDQESRYGTDDLESGQGPTRVTTDDILKDLKLTGIQPKQKKAQEDEAEKMKKLKDMLERAKEEGTFVAQVHKKLEEDVKIDNEKELLSRNDIGSTDMAAVKTDDEDDELAYEEWKLREIKRVLRDRLERSKVK